MARRVASFLVMILTFLRMALAGAMPNNNERNYSDGFVGDAAEMPMTDGWGLLMALADTGCTDSVMTTEWKASADKKLAQYGLRMIRIPGKTRVFRGLGGVQVKAEAIWRMPCGIGGKHVDIEIAEVPGAMPTLISKKDLRDWGCNMFLGHGVTDFEHLDLYGLNLPESKNGHIQMDLFDFDETNLDSLSEFALPGMAGGDAHVIDIEDAGGDAVEIRNDVYLEAMVAAMGEAP